MVQNTDQKTLDLIKEVNKRKAEIALAEKPYWLTNCSFYYDENNKNNAVNIQVESSVKKLVSIAAFVLDKEESFKRAAVRLDIETPDFTWDGFTVDSWIEDLKMRINKIQVANKRKKLEMLESKLNAIISPKLRTELEELLTGFN